MQFITKYKKVIFTLICILCILMALFSINRATPTFLEEKLGFIITPIQKINTNISSWIGSKYSAYLKYEELEAENEELKLQISLKNQQLTRLKQLEIENQKLLDLLEMSSRYGQYEQVAANIIAKDPGNWYTTFIIDKGYNDNLTQDMVVISSEGLVGIIKECGPNYSKVVSIIDDINSVSAKSLRTEDIGFVRGDLSNKGLLKMQYIDSEAEIIEGDEIVTSHLSDIYPPGIPIGYVKEISLDKNNLSQTATIVPYVDFKHLENVLVITSSSTDVSLDTSQNE